jgi:hypothetical protein
MPTETHNPTEKNEPQMSAGILLTLFVCAILAFAVYALYANKDVPAVSPGASVENPNSYVTTQPRAKP